MKRFLIFKNNDDIASNIFIEKAMATTTKNLYPVLLIIWRHDSSTRFYNLALGLLNYTE